MEDELTSLKAKSNDSGTLADGKNRMRRTELETKIEAHLEYVRFLTFVRRSLVGNRSYRISLADMSSLELMPKGSYR